MFPFLSFFFLTPFFMLGNYSLIRIKQLHNVNNMGIQDSLSYYIDLVIRNIIFIYNFKKKAKCN